MNMSERRLEDDSVVVWSACGCVLWVEWLRQAHQRTAFAILSADDELISAYNTRGPGLCLRERGACGARVKRVAIVPHMTASIDVFKAAVDALSTPPATHPPPNTSSHSPTILPHLNCAKY